MKKILLGFIAIVLFTFVGCEREDDDTDTTNTSSLIEYGDGATDIDGNIYKSVIIGGQEWMLENLSTSKYSDGTTIPNVTDEYQWSHLTTGACCYYNNDSQNVNTYAKLYNWYAVETGKLCPTGWHVPTDLEWTVLTDYLAANGYTGTALKATSGWDYGNGTDNYGWLGLPVGNRHYDGYFNYFGSAGSWWSSSEDLMSYAWSRYLVAGSGLVGRFNLNKTFGFSVRCIKD